jgi:hypothetical protein
MSTRTPTGRDTTRATRANRLAAALKSNLRRRKTQARARSEAGDDPAADHPQEAGTDAVQPDESGDTVE